MVHKHFRKSKRGEATRYLFVGNCSSSLEGITEALIEEVFSKFGACDVHFPAAKSHVFITYGTTQEANTALEALNGVACGEMNGRVLVVRYADVPNQTSVPPVRARPMAATSLALAADV